MLPPALSPVHILVSTWRKSRLARRDELSACRSALLTAAVREIAANNEQGILYDPVADQRFQWALQWIAVSAEERRAIDPDTEFLTSLLLQDCPLSGKLSASGA